MKKLVNKHPNSKNCFICGLDNPKGLKAEFFATEDGKLVSFFTPDVYNQSYPGVLHGGISAALLDELTGRVIQVVEPDVFGMTSDLSIKYKKPLPYDVELKGVATLTRNTKRVFEAESVIYTPDNEIAVIAKAKYLKMPVNKISSDFDLESEWFVETKADDPTEVDL